MKDIIPLDSKSKTQIKFRSYRLVLSDLSTMLLNQLHILHKIKDIDFSIFKINVVPVGRNVFVLAFLVVMEMNYSLGRKGIPQSRGCGVIWWVERASWRQHCIYSWC